MILTPATCLDLWYAAVEQEFGLRLVVANPKDIRAIQGLLYKVRQDTGDEGLQALAVTLPKGGKEIWLTKKTTDMTEGPVERKLIPNA